MQNSEPRECPLCGGPLEGEQVYCSVACVRAADQNKRLGGRLVSSTPVDLPRRKRVTNRGDCRQVMALAQTKVREGHNKVEYVWATAGGFYAGPVAPPPTQNYYRVYRDRVELWEPTFGEEASQ